MTFPPPNDAIPYDDFERGILLHLTDYIYAAGSAFKTCRFIIGVGLANYEYGQQSALLRIMDKATWIEADNRNAARLRTRLGAFKSVHAERPER